MDTITLEQKINTLPENLKQEAILFLDFLLFKSNFDKSFQNREPGFMKGKISISDDFNEPLEEFLEYM